MARSVALASWSALMSSITVLVSGFEVVGIPDCQRNSSRFDNIIQENNIFSANIFCAMLRFMVVELRIREAAEARGITTAYQLQKRMNVPPGTAARLWRGDMKMIGLDTIETLCEAIGCEPADLIVRVLEKKKNVSGKRLTKP